MADFTIELGEKTRGSLTLEWPQVNDVPSTISGWTFKLLVKRSVEDTDDIFWVNLTGTIVSATDRTVRFDFTVKETAMPPGTWPGEIQAWESTPSGSFPHHRKTVDYIINTAVKQKES